MENRLNPAGEGESQKKEWYKKWWGIIIALVIWPLFAIWYTTHKTNWSKEKQGFAIVGVIILAIFIYGGNKSENKQAPNQEKVAVENKQSQQPTEEKIVTQETKTEAPQINTIENSQPKQPEIKIPKYEIVHEVSGKRYDGGINYIILVDPVNIKNDIFKEDIKNITKQLVKDKGSKISIDILDDKKTLELYNESHYGKGTLDRILTKQEMDMVGLHLVASFSGQLETMIYPNSLAFFPGTFTDNPKVGKYVQTIEFNPSQN